MKKDTRLHIKWGPLISRDIFLPLLETEDKHINSDGHVPPAWSAPSPTYTELFAHSHPPYGCVIQATQTVSAQWASIMPLCTLPLAYFFARLPNSLYLQASEIHYPAGSGPYAPLPTIVDQIGCIQDLLSHYREHTITRFVEFNLSLTFSIGGRVIYDPLGFLFDSESHMDLSGLRCPRSRRFSNTSGRALFLLYPDL